MQYKFRKNIKKKMQSTLNEFKHMLNLQYNCFYVIPNGFIICFAVCSICTFKRKNVFESLKL